MILPLTANHTNHTVQTKRKNENRTEQKDTQNKRTHKIKEKKNMTTT